MYCFIGRWGADDGSNFKAALLSGPPGVGKTTTAQLVCKVWRIFVILYDNMYFISFFKHLCQELNVSYTELNASDTRSKKSLQEEVARMLQNKSLANYMAGM